MKHCEMLSSGRDIAIAHMNSQQLWFCAQDLHKSCKKIQHGKRVLSIMSSHREAIFDLMDDHTTMRLRMIGVKRVQYRL